MGCASSKRVEVAEEEEVYRPPPASIAYFDISTIGEPWLITTTTAESVREKSTTTTTTAHLALPILEKVDAGYDLPPQSWSEVSKALEDLKPSLLTAPLLPPNKQQPPTTNPLPATTVATTPLFSGGKPAAAAVVLPEGLRPVSQNSFVLRDREEREKSSSNQQAGRSIRRRIKRDPFEGLPELCPPGGAESVVLYTTSLRGVRRTFEDCERARQVLDLQCPPGVEVDERDVSLHGEYLRELRELLHGDGASAVPRLFVKGRYVGGVEEVVGMNEVGRIGEMMRMVRKRGEEEKGSRRGCEGCGGARFVPCLECNGSCKVVEGEEDGEGVVVVRCGECNENGLVHCPLCY